jgi:glutamine amidotransferase
VSNLLFDPDNSLVRQSYSPRMMNTFLNLAGFGLQAWDPTSLEPEHPFTYRVTTLPSFDRNLRFLSSKLAPTCLVAHIRGVTYSHEAVVTETNLHPFRFVGTRVVLAHNGRLREFPRMRYALVEHVRPELAQRIEGTTDSEWIYALILSQLDDLYGLPETRELADATVNALRIVHVRAAARDRLSHGLRCSRVHRHPTGHACRRSRRTGTDVDRRGRRWGRDRRAAGDRGAAREAPGHARPG